MSKAYALMSVFFGAVILAIMVVAIDRIFPDVRGLLYTLVILLMSAWLGVVIHNYRSKRRTLRR